MTDISLRLKVDNADEAIQVLRRFGVEGSNSLGKIEASAPRAAKAMSNATDAVSRSSNQARFATQNLSFQLQDVFVQMESGTDVSRIFAQQGPQIASAFGPAGAVVGVAAAAIGFFASQLLKGSEEVDSFEEALNLASDASDRFADTLAGQSSTLDELLEGYERLTAQQQELAALNLEALIKDQTAALEAQRGQIIKTFEDIEQAATLVDLRRQEISDPRVAANIASDTGLQPADLGNIEALRDLFRALQDGTLATTDFLIEFDKLAGLEDGIAQFGDAAVSNLIDIARSAELTAEELKKTQAELALITGQDTSSTNAALNTAPPGQSDELTKQLRKESDARREAVVAAAQQAEEAARLSAALAQGEAAHQAVANAIEIENAARAAGIDLATEEGKNLANFISQKQKEAAAIESINASRAAADQASKDAAATAKRDSEAAERAAQREADAADRAAERQAQLIATAEIEADQRRRLASAIEISEQAHEAVSDAIEIENALRQANLSLLTEEGRQLASAVRAQQQYQDAINQSNEARRKADQDANDAERELERQAEASADAVSKPFENALTSIQSQVANTFTDAFDGSVTSAEDAAQAITSTFTRMSGELLALAIFDPAAFQGVVNGINAGGAQGYLGAAAIGASAGGLSTAVTGGNPLFGQLGGVGGALAGFAIGNLIAPGVGGFAGAAVGGLGGGLLGGAIGGSENQGRNRANEYLNLATGAITGDRSPARGDPNREAAIGIAEQTFAIVEALRDVGTTFEDGIVRISVSRTQSAEEATANVIESLLARASNDNQIFGSILANTDATNFEQLSADFAFGELFEDLTNAITPAEKSLRELNRQFDVADQRARDLGLSEAVLAQSRVEAQQDLLTLYEDQLRNQAQAVESIFAANINSLQSGLNSITFGDNSRLSTESQLNQSRALFDEAVASGADFSTISTLAQQTNDLAREFYGSGAGFQQVNADIAGVLTAALADQQAQSDTALEGLADVLIDSERVQTDRMIEVLNELQEEVRRLGVALAA